MTNVIKKIYKNGTEYDIYASGGAAGTGDVTGPSSSTDADIALFSGATGKIIKDSGKKLSDYQTALSTQTAYSSKGSATKVPQITTNTLGQVTGITEVTITQPTVNNATLTIQKNSTNVATFTANASSNVTANISVPTDTNDLTNGAGFITGISSSDVTTALGYTPVNPSSLGTAASKNTGTSSGNVPVLDSNGKLSTSTLPGLALTDTFTVTNKSDLTSLSSAEQGDVGIVTSESKTYILSQSPYSTASNWKELLSPTDAVTSVNGKTGAVTLNADDISDATTTNKFVTASDKTTWSGKQDALATQTAYTAKGSTTKVPIITTNTLGQVTEIAETAITFPVTSVNGSTGAVTGLQTTSNLKTSLTDNSDSYYPSQKAVKTAVDGKQDTLVNQTNIKSINGNSLLGSGDLTISGGISNDTTGTTSTVTGIWAGSEAEYTNLSTKSGTVLYFTF